MTSARRLATVLAARMSSAIPPGLVRVSPARWATRRTTRPYAFSGTIQ